MSIPPREENRGVRRCPLPRTLDKMNDDRKHLTALEVEKLLTAAKGRRNEARDRCLIMLMFRHGLRVAEAVGLQLSALDLEGRSLHVARLKRGLSTTHPLRGDELRALRAWLTQRAHEAEDHGAVWGNGREAPMNRNRTVKMWPRISVFRIGPGSFLLQLPLWLAPMRFHPLKIAGSGHLRKFSGLA